MTALLLTLSAVFAQCASASDEFLQNMHKAQSRREPDEIIEYYTRAIRAWDPSDGNALLGHCHFGRGEALLRRYEFREAEPDLSKSLELDPRNSRALFLRGRVHFRLDRFEKAARDLREYAASNPEDPEGFLALGKAYRMQAKHEPALKAYRRAAELGPGDFRPALEIAQVWMARKDWGRAVESLEGADELAHRLSAEVFAADAVCRAAAGKPEKALSDYDRAIPLFERRLQDLHRSGAHPVEIGEWQDQLAQARTERGRLDEFLLRLVAALADYREACRLGSPEACRRASALAAKPETRGTPAVEPEEKPKPEARKEGDKARKRIPAAKSEPGERIYAP